MQRISIIIPVLNEAAIIVACLRRLQGLRQRECELIIADGGSTDATLELATPLADKVVTASPGRALQMNAGAAVASGECLWFLHSDSIIPMDADDLIRARLSHYDWGRFDVRLSGSQTFLRLIELTMNLRSRLSGIATGDQGIFVRRNSFEKIGGYPAIALMEDIALSKRLKRISKSACIDTPLITSSRRWERDGIMQTMLLMWRLRLAYFFGADPNHLATLYYRR